MYWLHEKTTLESEIHLFFYYFFAANFNFLLRYSCYKAGSDEGKKALNMVIKTLEFMEKGGIHDHVGQVRKYF